ncbi:MAG TPA: cohesin domain-containing protein [bacterium]|nr:cohesin domain-containing protein [bacterium]
MKRNLFFILLSVMIVVPAMAEDMSMVKAQGDRIWISSDTAAPGEQVTVDLMIENAMTEVDAVTLTVTYDTSKLQFVDWADGSLDPGWVMFNINEKNIGEISIGGFCVKTSIQKGSKGSLARLNFKVKSDADGYSYITLDKIRDDLEGFNFENGKIEVKGAALSQ